MKRKGMLRRRIGLMIILAGLGFVLYPLTSILANNWMAERRMEEFRQQENAIPAEELAARLELSRSYNESLDGTADGAVDPFDVKNYATVNPLDYEDGDVFGYLEVPKIDEVLPIYLGASPYHLSLGVAQVDGTNLPVGGKDTRSVIAGHRGFTTQAMFRALDKLAPGDIVTLRVLGDVLEYEVYDSEVIQPSEYQKLALVPGQDTLTLLTCTPYMVFTERLLVNAVRVNAPEEGAEVAPSAGGEGAETAGSANAEAAQASPAVDRTVQLQKWALTALVAALWVALAVVVLRLLGTLRGRS